MGVKLVAAGLGLVVALGGCATVINGHAAPSAAGGSAAGGSAAVPAGGVPAGVRPPVNPCEILPRAEAEALAGKQLGPSVVSNPDTPTCTYPTTPSGSIAQVELFVGDGAKKFYDIEVLLEHEFTDVAGLGDEAHSEGGTIFFRKGGTWVGLRLTTTSSTDATPAAVTAEARAIAGRI